MCRSKYSWLIAAAWAGVALLAYDPASVNAQTGTGVVLRFGLYHPDTYLRTVPAASETGRNERSYLTPAPFVSAAMDLPTPIRWIRAEISGMSTIAGNLATRRLERQDCGADCTLAIERSQNLSRSAIYSAGVSLIGSGPTFLHIVPKGVLGAGVRHYTFDTADLPEAYAKAFPGGQTNVAYHYGIQLAVSPTPEFTLFLDGQRFRSSVSVPISTASGAAAEGSQVQHDFQIAAGVRYKLRH